MVSLLDLPPELVDSIIDLLRNDRKTLKCCCLASGLFVPRAQKHLFGTVIMNRNVGQRWNKTFPDRANPPASAHARFLVVRSVRAVSIKDAEQSGWIRSFTKVVRLEVCDFAYRGPTPNGSLTPLSALSSVKFLRLSTAFVPPIEILTFICSFPVLEDLDIKRCLWVDEDIKWSNTIEAPTQQPLTGTLTIQGTQLKIIACLLLALKTGLRFRKIKLKVNDPGELEAMVPLVEACSNTLEFIRIDTTFIDSIRSIDLSKARKLERMEFYLRDLESITWITETLRTITPDNKVLRDISFHMIPQIDGPEDVGSVFGERICQRWMSLDGLLTQICQSGACRMKAVLYGREDWIRPVRRHIKGLLPETTKRGLIKGYYGRGRADRF